VFKHMAQTNRIPEVQAAIVENVRSNRLMSLHLDLLQTNRIIITSEGQRASLTQRVEQHTVSAAKIKDSRALQIKVRDQKTGLSQRPSSHNLKITIGDITLPLRTVDIPIVLFQFRNAGYRVDK